nr:tail fiber assembly protein [uncultured Pseudomonas sp.]
MKNYVRVVNGIVIEFIAGAVYDAPPPEQEANVSPEVWQMLADRAGTEIPIAERFTPEFVAELVDVTGIDPVPVQGMTYANGVFLPPAGPTPAEIYAANKAMRDSLLATATLAIAPLQDAYDLDEATPAELALLKAWKQYRVAVNRVELTQAGPAWPSAPA